MRIRLNGESQDAEEAGSVETLLAALKLDTRKIAVELNRAIVPRSLYGETKLSDGDEVEIVRFIGGG